MTIQRRPAPGTKLNGAHLANLHTFLIAARYLSFSRAANELCLTPSAISHRIARLEDALQLTLFDRLPRQVRLTEDGERIFLIMQETMDGLSEALQERSRTTIAGRLAVFVQPSFAQCWLTPRLAQFCERYPEVQLDIRVGNERVDYRTRHIDLFLTYSNGDFPGLASEKLMPERIAPVCSPAYASKHGLSAGLQALSSCTALHDVQAWEDASFDAEWKLWAQAAGASEHLSERLITFERSDLCVVAAINDAGIAIGREQLVRHRIANGELVLPFGGFIDAREHGYYLVYPPRTPLPRRLSAFTGWLHECAAQAGEA